VLPHQAALFQIPFVLQAGSHPALDVKRHVLDHSLQAEIPLEEDTAGIHHLHRIDLEVEDNWTGLAGEKSIGREVAGCSQSSFAV
jgi:hypothetical protein